MTSRERILIWRIAVCLSLFVIALPTVYFGWLFSVPLYAEVIIFTAMYLLAGYEVLWRAVRNIFRGRVFDEHFLMTTATIGAFALGEFAEGVAVMLFYQIGEYFSSRAVKHSRQSIAKLMDIRPDTATVLRNKKELVVAPETVEIGEHIIVKVGERIALDGVITEGVSTVDTSSLTGEAMPRDISAGDEVLSGTVNLTGKITIRTTKTFSQSTATKILELVEKSADKKSKSENFIHKFARVYTPLVVCTAVLLGVLPPLFFSQSFAVWVERALTFLVISCPCALVISVPLSFFGGVGCASKNGILIKGSCYMETLTKVKTVVFDKTGTLTNGRFTVTEIIPNGISKAELLRLTTTAEWYSNHPIAVSIKNEYGKEIDTANLTYIEEVAGCGVSLKVGGERILAGNEKLMKAHKIPFADIDSTGTKVYVAKGGKYLGCIVIADEIKADAKTAILSLKRNGIRRTIMLTGDSSQIGESVAKTIGIDEVYTELLPADKVEIFERLLDENRDGKIAFVGDGINDAPVLARADIGIAMGGVGSDASIEAADIVLMTDEPKKITDAIKIAKRTMGIVKQNIIFSLAVKTAVLLFGAVGFVNMWAAIFADVGVSVIAILNSMRALKYRAPK